MQWHADDGNAEIIIECDTAEEAAQEYVDGGDWGEVDTTLWIRVFVWQEGGDTVTITVQLDPPEPPCVDGDHVWEAPHSIVGGIEENPGVWGHGGGVIIKAVCLRCGCGRLTDTWAQCPSTGEQGLRSVTYDPDYLAQCDEDDDDDRCYRCLEPGGEWDGRRYACDRHRHRDS